MTTTIKNPCPICLEEIFDECSTGCGHKFCLKCILKWSKHHTCPCCREELGLKSTKQIDEMEAELKMLKESKVYKLCSFISNIMSSFS